MTIPFATLTSGVGSTTLTADADGNLRSRTLYSAWGEVRHQAGAIPTDYTYTGQYSNTADFGLMYYRARWYDPSLGRFSQADTVVPGAMAIDFDRYAYVRNSPTGAVDPSGHYGVCIHGGPAGKRDADASIKGYCAKIDPKVFGGDSRNPNFDVYGNNPKDLKEAFDTVSNLPDGEPVVIIGYSWGATAALELAHRLNKQGIRVNVLILIDPIGGRSILNAETFPIQDDEVIYPDAPSTIPGHLSPPIVYKLPPVIPDNVDRALLITADGEEPFNFSGMVIRMLEIDRVNGAQHISLPNAIHGDVVSLSDSVGKAFAELSLNVLSKRSIPK